MPKAAVGQTGFTTGEVSPLCYGITDNPRYKKGLETCLNYIPTLQGPLIRRPGTKYVNDVKDSANPPNLIPFQFSANQNYMLEFGNNYIRFYTNNGQMVTVGTSYKLDGLLTWGGVFHATRANTNLEANEAFAGNTPVAPGSILELTSPYNIADIPLIRWAQKGDTIYLVHPNYPVYKLQRETNTAWKIAQVYFTDGPYLPLNTYKTTGDYVNTILTWVTVNTPTPTVITNSVSITGAAAGAGGQIVITTGSVHGFLSGQRIFISQVGGTVEANNTSTYPGRTSANPTPYWLIQVLTTTSFLLLGSVFTNAYTSGGSAYIGLIDGNNDSRRALAFIQAGERGWGLIQIIYDAATFNLQMGGTSEISDANIPNTIGPATAWSMGVWSAATGYPACVTFHQDRLVFSGVPNYPQRVDASNVGFYEQFSPSDWSNLTVRDSDSFSFDLNSEDSNPIRWMKSTAQGLLAASASSEWAMTPSGNSEALTPTNFNAQQTSFFGSAQVDAVKIGNAVMYIQRAYRKLREMAYFFSAGTYRSSDLTEISEHITLPKITKLAIQKETQPLIWAIRSDGYLTSLVYNRDDISLSAGWARHPLGGKSNIAGDPAAVYDFGIITDPTISYDEMWLVVKRYINGATVYTVEYMTKITNDEIAQADSFQLDCGATYNGAPVLHITGLSWLEGETVGVLTDGGIHPDCVVTGGQITLNYTASKVQVGYRYKSQGKVLRAEAGSADGTSIGKTRRTTRAALQLHRVGDMSIGTDFNNLIPLEFAQGDQNLADTAVPLFSGIIREGLESAYDFESQLCFEQSSPLPGVIQSITTFLDEFDV